MKAEKALDAWSGYAGSYVSTDEWIDSLVAGLRGTCSATIQGLRRPLPSYAEGGGGRGHRPLQEAEVGAPQGLRSRHRLARIGASCSPRAVRAGRALLEASLASTPVELRLLHQHDLAVAHDRLGHREAAVRQCRAAARAEPGHPRIAAFLQDSRAGPERRLGLASVRDQLPSPKRRGDDRYRAGTPPSRHQPHPKGIPRSPSQVGHQVDADRDPGQGDQGTSGVRNGRRRSGSRTRSTLTPMHTSTNANRVRCW